MDLKRLEYFLLVADYGSFSRASSVIGIAQPALGRQVQKLEEDHGVKLLYRHGRGVSLTPEGQEFSERIRPLLAELTLAIDDLHASKQAIKGAVTLGITPTVMSLAGLPCCSVSALLTRKSSLTSLPATAVMYTNGWSRAGWIWRFCTMQEGPSTSLSIPWPAPDCF